MAGIKVILGYSDKLVSLSDWQIWQIEVECLFMYVRVPKLGNIIWTQLPDTDSYNTTNQFPTITSTSILWITIEENHTAKKTTLLSLQQLHSELALGQDRNMHNTGPSLISTWHCSTTFRSLTNLLSDPVICRVTGPIDLRSGPTQRTLTISVLTHLQNYTQNGNFLFLHSIQEFLLSCTVPDFTQLGKFELYLLRIKKLLLGTRWVVISPRR